MLKRVLSLSFLFVLSACSTQNTNSSIKNTQNTQNSTIHHTNIQSGTRFTSIQTGKMLGENSMGSIINMKIGTSFFQITLAENQTAEAFRQLLPLTVKMQELNGYEKYGELPQSLPSISNQSPNQSPIQNGDLILYGNSTLVLFYKDSSTSNSYTTIGKVVTPEDLESILGSENQTITFERNANNEEAEKNIRNLRKNFAKHMIDGDVSKLENLVDKNYTLKHITGRIQSKEEWFDEIRNQTMKYHDIKEVSLHISIDGDKAQAIERNFVDATIWGSRNIRKLQSKIGLEKRNGKWIILNTVTTTFS